LAYCVEITAKYAAIHLPSQPRAMARFLCLIQSLPFTAWFLLLEIARLHTAADSDRTLFFIQGKPFGTLVSIRYGLQKPHTSVISMGFIFHWYKLSLHW